MSLAAKLLATLIALPAAGLIGLALFSAFKAATITQENPNRGSLTDVDGVAINALFVPAGPQADLPPLVFIHGASGNLNDPAGAFLEPLSGRSDLLFLDRPGHGYSERGGDNGQTPDRQADLIAGLMEKKGIKRAIIVGHSFGGAITMALTLRHPDKVSGLVLLSAATHPWPGGVDWYYDVADTPLIGTLFCRTLALPAGLLRMEGGIASVFSPNPVPPDYLKRAQIPLVLRPETFCNNARDVANLHRWVDLNQPRYASVAVPTVVLTGDSDDIVYEEIHSRGLARDIAGSELLWIRGLGHKPDYVATDLAIAAIEKVAGKPRDLQALARETEARLSAGR